MEDWRLAPLHQIQCRIKAQCMVHLGRESRWRNRC